MEVGPGGKQIQIEDAMAVQLSYSNLLAIEATRAVPCQNGVVLHRRGDILEPFWATVRNFWQFSVMRMHAAKHSGLVSNGNYGPIMVHESVPTAT